jgi:uncharacterized protein YcaQ
MLAERGKTAREILARLKAEGALATGAVSKVHGKAIDWAWAPTAEGRAVLEALFATGRVGIARRDASRRTFDLIERLFPAELLAKKASVKDAMRHRLLSRYRAMGLLGTGGSSEIFWSAGTAQERARMLGSFVRERLLVPIEVEGVRGERYAVGDELAILEETSRNEGFAPSVAFLAPLDPLMWDRKLLRALYGFDYIWEVYTPEVKRKHGYYVLPILFGERIVGRIEPKIDRREGVLHVIGVWWEDGFDPAQSAFVEAMREALRAYCAFVGADRLVWGRSRATREMARRIG